MMRGPSPVSQLEAAHVLWAMNPHSYLIHRASKRAKPSKAELRLIDRDLAEAGVHIPWTRGYDADVSAIVIAQRVMQDVLEAA